MPKAKSSIRGFVLPLLDNPDNGAIAEKVMKAFPKFHAGDPGYVRKQVADIRWRKAHAKKAARKAAKKVKARTKKSAAKPAPADVAQKAPAT